MAISPQIRSGANAPEMLAVAGIGVNHPPAGDPSDDTLGYTGAIRIQAATHRRRPEYA